MKPRAARTCGYISSEKTRDHFCISPPPDFSLHHMAIGTDSIIIRSSRIDLHPCGSVPRKVGGWKGINKRGGMSGGEKRRHHLRRVGNGSVVLSARHVWLRGGSSLEIALRVFPWCTLTGTRFRAERRRLSSALFIRLAPSGFSWPYRARSEIPRPLMQFASFSGNNKYRNVLTLCSRRERGTITLLFRNSPQKYEEVRFCSFIAFSLRSVC